MTNPIPQAAIYAAATALHSAFTEGRDEEPADYVDEAVTALEAAMPHIRKQIAGEIRAEMPALTTRAATQTLRACMEHAARIAEGETK